MVTVSTFANVNYHIYWADILTYNGLNRTYHPKYWAKPYFFLAFLFLCMLLDEGLEERNSLYLLVGQLAMA